MNSALSLGLWILVLSAAVGGLKCYKCNNERSDGTCIFLKPPCEAKEGESCFRQQLYTEFVRLYSVAGCVSNCRDVSGGRHIKHSNTCCKEKDLCNASPS